MKFRCGYKAKLKHRARKYWHSYFAWLPVSVGEHDCRWLEFVERKGRWKDGWCLAPGCAPFKTKKWYWEYRAK